LKKIKTEKEKPKEKKEDQDKRSQAFVRKSAKNVSESEKEKSEASEEDDIEKKESRECEEAGKGHFLLGDIPDKIATIKPMQDKIEVEVNWKKRKSGKMPSSTKFSSVDLRKYNKDLLLDFYESKLKFVAPKASEKEGK